MRVLLAALILTGAICLPISQDQNPSMTSLKRMSKMKMLRYVKTEVSKPENRKMSCFACTMAVDGVQALIAENKTDTEIADFLTNLCDFFNVEQPHVCKHIILAFESEVVFVLERTVFTPDEICGAFVADCGQSVNPFHVFWNLTIPDGKPPNKPWPKIPDGKPTYKMLHLSDIHIDRQYAVGTEAYCELDDFLGTYVQCCRNYTDEDSVPSRKSKPIYVPAGKWGMPYSCDLPYQTFISALKHISTTHKDLDYIIITGDFEAHDSWDYSEDLTRNNVENITAALLQFFPTTPIYVAIGNHEGVPQDAMAPHTMPEYDTRGPQWLYSIMKDMWSHWIPSSALPDVQYRASYAVYPKPGLKLISINTVYCSEFNFYLYIDQTDPDSTLAWLIDQLADSEGKGELVHIISHIPPGSDYCLPGWSANFFRIVDRYRNTIAQMFYGHTHQDHFQVYYEQAHPDANPFHFNWITPSITTFAWNNPSYRIFTIDGGYSGATYTVKEADTYSTNLEVANDKNQEPIWSLEYSYKAFYNMTDLSPQSFSDLSNRLWTQPDLFRSFVKFYYRQNYNNECYQDAQCRRGFICEMKKARSYDESFCLDLD